jgi:hypothetical protein
MDHVSEIEEKMKELAHVLYKNPRIKNVDMCVDTLMGTSITYTSYGDPDSPVCRAETLKDGLCEARNKDAIQDDKRPSGSRAEAPKAGPGRVPGGLQQWMGTDP